MKLWNITLFWDGVGKDIFRNEKLIELYLNDISLWREYLYNNIWVFIDKQKLNLTMEDYNENKWEIMLFLDDKISKQLSEKADYTQKRCNQIVRYLKISLWWYMFNKKIRVEHYISTDDLKEEKWQDWPFVERDTDLFLSNVIYNSCLSEKDIKICLLIKMKISKKTIMKTLSLSEKKYDRVFNNFRKLVYKACREL